MRRRSKTLQVLPAFLLAAYPLCVIFGANPGLIIADYTVVARDLTVVWVGVAALMWGLRLVIRDFAIRAAWLNWFLLTQMLYLPVVMVSSSRGMPVDAFSPRFAILYTAAALVAATVVSRPWQRNKMRDPWPMNFVAGTIVVLSLFPWLRVANPSNASVWRKPVDTIIESPKGVSARPHQQRNIYYIVLDGMGSPETLRSEYELDTTPFLEFLRSHGFHVPEQARSNYGQTYLSLASTLNMTYLDGVSQAVGRESVDRRPLHHLVQHNALMRIARQAGYRVTAIGSDYQATEGVSDVDVCICPRYGLDELEIAAITLTPLAPVPVDSWTFDAHRRKVLESFEAIERAGSGQEPQFVFAHIIAPHPPFLFGPDGSSRRPRWTKSFSFFDGNHFGGSGEEYRSGYRDQMSFVMARLTEIVGRLLAREEMEPVIIIHGDHGPGKGLQWESVEQTNVAERFQIFAAYKFPGISTNVDIQSPVNGTRALAREYFGADLAPLPDDSFYSRWTRPYDFVPVDVTRNTKARENTAAAAVQPFEGRGSSVEIATGPRTSTP